MSFKKTFIITTKNLFRSGTFWLSLGIIIIVAVQNALSGFHAVFNMELMELIYDTDPRYLLDYQTYIKWLSNSFDGVLSYSVPLLVVVSTAIIVNHDYKDSFFEIEKAAGIKPKSYTLGRLSALFLVGIITAFLAHFISLHLYVFTRGGVMGIHFIDYIIDSTFRLVLINCFRAWPCIVFYIGLTYCLGSLLKNGAFASIGSLAYVLTVYAADFLIVSKDNIFFNYFSPQSSIARDYFYYYDTEWFEVITQRANINYLHVSIGILFLLGVGIICAYFSLHLTSKRSV